MMLQDCSEITVEQFQAMHRQKFEMLVKKHRRTWTRECGNYRYQGAPARKVRHGKKVYDNPEAAAIALGVTSNAIRLWCKMKLNGWERL